MKLPISWINDYTNISDVSAAEFAHGMTMSGSKVEGVENAGSEIKNVVVGKLLSVVKHPNADSLVICSVDVGQQAPIQIVTGAKNVKEGDYVPVALHGAKLPGGVSIKKGKLRGEVSNGMLCSFQELGMSLEDVPYADENGILILQEAIEPGTDIKQVFPLDEAVVEFEITSNRPDCFSVIGLAREAAVTFERPFAVKEPQVKGGAGNVHDLAKVTVQDGELCPRYAARVVKNVKIGRSPKWLRDRLTHSGIRSINNIVDITNYVLLEYGQPMHAFNLADIAGSEIVVRHAGDGETIRTLDGQMRKLDSSMLVICDAEKPIAVAGVMGGENSEITNDSAAILFESANFNGVSVRKTAQKLGLRTEASSRYEKGLDPNNVIAAVNRACELVELLGAGEVTDGIIDVDNSGKQPRKIELRPDKINAFLGTDIPREFMVKTLTNLGFVIEGDWITVPTFRPDVIGEADIAEEIVRIYGYNKITSTLLRGETTHGIKTRTQRIEEQVHALLTAQGLYETETFSFTSPQMLAQLDGGYEKELVVISNPLGEETSVMRTTLLASMLGTLSLNHSHRNAAVKAYEVANVYLPRAGEKLPDEHNRIALGMYGDCDFYTIKGVVENLLDGLRISDVSFVPESSCKTFHPGRCARVLAGDTVLGIFGEVHPSVAARFDIGERAYIGEFDFPAICERYSDEIAFRPLPKFPAVTRDLAVLVDSTVLVGELETVIRSCAGGILESVRLFDVYTGAQVPEGKKSVAYSIVYRAADRTLTDEEIGNIMDKTVSALQQQLGAQLR